MSRPTAAEHGASFDLPALVEALRAEEPYAREGRTARTLLRAPGLRIVLVVLRGGSTIAEHRVDVAASVQVISGALRLQLPDRAVELHAGELMALGAALAHDVHARTDGAFLLTLGGSAS